MAHGAKVFGHDKVGTQFLRACRLLPGEGASSGSVSAAVQGDGPSCAAVETAVDLAGLVGDGERPRLARSAVGALLFSLSFGGVLLGGLE